jgi:dolichyl-phosphate-mannose--protein O-mannosyl transferase
LVVASLLIQYAFFEEFPLFPYFDEVYTVPASRAVATAPHTMATDHPPLAPYLMSLSENVFGDNPTGWRFPSRVCGALILPAVFLIGLLLTGSVLGSTLGAVALFCDGLFVTLSRAALWENPYVCFGVYAILVALWGERQKGQKAPILALIISGILIGLSLTSKWAGVFFIAPLALIYLLSDRPSSIARKLGVIMCPPCVGLSVYVAMTCSLRDLSIAELATQTLDMLRTHVNFEQPHRYASSAWGWPVLARPIWFGYTKLPYIADDGAQAIRGTLCAGNPAVFFFTGLSILWLVISVLKNVAHRNLQLVTTLPVVGYFACWIPWIVLSSRKGFLYYFYPSLVFACIGLGVSCAALSNHGRNRKMVCALVGALMLGCFIAYLPLYVGTPITQAHVRKLILTQSWW